MFSTTMSVDRSFEGCWVSASIVRPASGSCRESANSRREGVREKGLLFASHKYSSLLVVGVNNVHTARHNAC